MRICSLLPGATEIAYALGLGDQIVGVTHECDFPAEAQYKPILVKGAIDAKRMSGAEIDRKVSELLRAGKGLYTLDEDAFIEAAPDVILTQGLCDVCALDHTEVEKAAAKLARVPQILSLNPHSFNDILDDIQRVGAITQRDERADALVLELRRRIEEVGYQEIAYRPRVVCLEWFEPLYTAGHWVPEMVALAGGRDILGRAGAPSAPIEWQQVIDADPEVILLMPCGFDTRRTVKEATPLRALPGWQDLPAVKSANVYAMNGNAYFSRPGPRLVNGLEILARIIHPNSATWSSPPADAARLN
jgi:iron complex transport system substrate-binding protein